MIFLHFTISGQMSSILRVPDIGGSIIWLWKRYIKKDKNVKLDDEVDDMSWRAWLVGAVAIFIFIFLNMIIVAICY